MYLPCVYDTYALSFKLRLNGVSHHDHVLCIVGGTVVEAAVIMLPDVWLEALGGVGMVDQHKGLIGILHGEIGQAAAFADKLLVGDIGLIVDLSSALKVKEGTAAV